MSNGRSIGAAKLTNHVLHESGCNVYSCSNVVGHHRVNTTVLRFRSHETLDNYIDDDIALTDELRTLYSWRNGSDPSLDIDAFPYMRFVPLSEALETREYLRKPDESKSTALRELQDAWLGFRYSWVGVLENGAGDGYFYDPDRRKDESCFFYTVHDDIGFMFYPSVANYIEQLVELDRRMELSGDETGVQQDSEWTYSEEEDFLNRFGQWVE